jgi:hypothetical protein
MFSKNALVCATAIGLAMAFAAPASAKTYTSSAAFASGVGPLSTEDYGAYSAGDLVPDGSTLGALTYNFSTAGGMGGVITGFYNSFTGLSLAAKQVAGPLDPADFFYGGDSFTVTFPTPVRAVGIFSNVNIPTAMALTTSTGSASTAGTVYDTSTFIFLGYTSPTPFTSASFFYSSSANVPQIEWSTFAGVPEPSSWALMLVGFAGLGAAVRGARRTVRAAA